MNLKEKCLHLCGSSNKQFHLLPAIAIYAMITYEPVKVISCQGLEVLVPMEWGPTWWIDNVSNQQAKGINYCRDT